MRTIIILLSILSLAVSCKTDYTQKNSEEEKIHKNLLGFKTTFLAELGDPNYDLLNSKVENAKIETKYINDIIYISYLEELNACGRYNGNIDISNDTITLSIGLISEEVCSSLAIKRITYLINNPTEDEKTIVKK